MNLLLADTFTSSLAKLTPDEQKSAKVTVVDLQLNPTNPGHSFHRIDRAKDKDFWSVRVNRDLRIIIHKRGANLLVCYVAHHDPAYAWAQNRRVENHPTTGVAQIVQLRETIRDIEIPNYVVVEPEPTSGATSHRAAEESIRQPFLEYSDENLLEWGVPIDWIDDVRHANEDQLLQLSDHLPAEAADALLELATGGTPTKPEPAGTEAEAFTHPDAQRRFRLITSDKELEAALDYPWDKWSVFLHPEQRKSVERSYNGAARVSGSAGTGKTIVALHRAVHLARKFEEHRILITTFSKPLSDALLKKLKILVYSEPMLIERISVENLESLAKRLHQRRLGSANIIQNSEIDQWIINAHIAAPPEFQRFSPRFLIDEWHTIIDAHQLKTEMEYRAVSRLGRRSRLSEDQRNTLWSFFQNLLDRLTKAGQITQEQAYTNLAADIEQHGSPFEHAIIDEAQDLSVSQLKFFAALGNSHPEGLFFAGDIGQRIFQHPFSWLSLGIDIRGRSSTLKVNYRTSHQIRSQSDRLLAPELQDPDGETESRRHTISVFNGPSPLIKILSSPEEEASSLQSWLTEQQQLGTEQHEIGIIVRSSEQISYAKQLVAEHSIQPNIVLMHEAKGLEFRSVAIVACNEDIIPLQERTEAASDLHELQTIHETERHLLYVASTRAREHLLITAQAPGSEFLEDLTT